MPMQDQAELFQTIAERVKRYRTERDWSQQELAERSGVSRRMIVMIEQAESNVSLGTLGKIALAFGMNFSHLIFSGEPEPLKIIPKADMPVIWRRGESQARYVMSVPAGDFAELWHWTLAPGDDYIAEPDPHGIEELIYVLQGQLDVTIDGAVFSLLLGDALRFPSQQPYHYHNPGAEPAIFIKNVLKA